MSDDELSNNIPELKKLIIDQHNQISEKDNLITEKDKLIQDLKDKINLLQKKQFAPKSEVVTSEELGLFNEAEEVDKDNQDNSEEESQEESSEESEEKEEEGKKKKKKKRARLPAHLPREEIIIDLDEKDKVCAHDGATLVKIGEEISEKLVIIPAKAIVKKTIRIKYGCPCCDESIKTPPPPVTILPKSMASASLVAYIVIAKYMDGLPLYRKSSKSPVWKY